MSSKTSAGLFERTKLYFAQVRTEIEKVTWPTQEQLKTYTIVVLVSTIIISILMGIWDRFLTYLLSLVLSIGGGS